MSDEEDNIKEKSLTSSTTNNFNQANGTHDNSNSSTLDSGDVEQAVKTGIHFFFNSVHFI